MLSPRLLDVSVTLRDRGEIRGMVCRGVSPTTAHVYPLKSQVRSGELARRHLATSSTEETIDKGWKVRIYAAAVV